MILARHPELPASLTVARPKRGGEVLVLVGGGLSAAKVRTLGAALLCADERRQLAVALRTRTRTRT